MSALKCLVTSSIHYMLGDIGWADLRMRIGRLSQRLLLRLSNDLDYGARGRVTRFGMDRRWCTRGKNIKGNAYECSRGGVFGIRTHSEVLPNSETAIPRKQSACVQHGA